MNDRPHLLSAAIKIERRSVGFCPLGIYPFQEANLAESHEDERRDWRPPQDLTKIEYSSLNVVDWPREKPTLATCFFLPLQTSVSLFDTDSRL
jgi:hypothetical protein